mmetsp:Transcript_31089/g.93238  ORF Transcript_31089/g.93238 Transcript_31089/m.93238 type:complete len:214 (+) Transcript_31089:211-852(+)
MVQRFAICILFIGVLSQVFSSGTTKGSILNGAIAPERMLQNQTEDEVIKRTKLILTPQSNVLSGVVAKYLMSLLDQALFNYAQLTQSLAVGRGVQERKISNVSSNLVSQMVDSVFVLGASDAYQNLIDTNNARTLLRGDKGQVSHSGGLRLLDEVSAGVLVSSLELDFSMLFALEKLTKEGPSVPDASKYMAQFFCCREHHWCFIYHCGAGDS